MITQYVRYAGGGGRLVRIDEASVHHARNDELYADRSWMFEKKALGQDDFFVGKMYRKDAPGALWAAMFMDSVRLGYQMTLQDALIYEQMRAEFMEARKRRQPYTRMTRR